VGIATSISRTYLFLPHDSIVVISLYSHADLGTCQYQVSVVSMPNFLHADNADLYRLIMSYSFSNIQ
jgi:hypothetical protein